MAVGTKADFIREITKRAVMDVGFGAVAKGSRYHVEFWNSPVRLNQVIKLSSMLTHSKSPKTA